ncbi:MAG: TIGR02647 family protein [Gammaproteobacteria bacterium]|nr:TIGR02647 family protein [Gammaproteobacteria bacterium]MCP4979768.1 TIGR02647 family protein [Gammaproteobacteria bacterium]
MSYSQQNIAELNLLMLFSSLSGLEGLKIHKNADASMIAAAQHLHLGGFITQVDGGYLTSLGVQAAEHAHALFTLLNSTDQVLLQSH